MNKMVISLLGPMQVTLDGSPVSAFEAESARALLAYLVMRRASPIPREILAGLLWPEWPEPHARRNLRSALYRLRTSIGDHEIEPHFLDSSYDTLQFNAASDYWLDVAHFTRLVEETHAHAHDDIEACPTCTAKLTEAVELYQGEFMSGFSYPSAPLEDWIVIERESLHVQALEALRHLAAYHERQGTYRQALDYARQQLALEPWRESAHRQAMRALALSGQRAAALAQYETCKHALADELGVEPEAATTELYGEIRAGSTGIPESPAQSGGQTEGRLLHVPLYSREDIRHIGETTAMPEILTVLVAYLNGVSDLRACDDLACWAAEMTEALEMLVVEGQKLGGTIHHYGHQHIALTFAGSTGHRNGPRRAVLAAMALSASFTAGNKRVVAGTPTDIRSRHLKVRIGVSTGKPTRNAAGFEAYIANERDGGTAPPWSMALILAEQVQAHVRNGTVWVDEETYERVAQDFKWAPRTTLSVAGVDHMVTLYHPVARRR